jgi:phage N-6-adenine-methyltransferase
MSLVGFKAQNHQQQLLAHGPRVSVDDRGTAPELFDMLHRRFSFTVDVAASEQNAKLPRFYTREQDGLTQPWAGERVWCNPPYSNLEPWVVKAITADAELVVMLMPANRTEQGWWQRHVEPRRDRPGSPLRTEFLPGRLRFIAPGANVAGPDQRPPFGCCLLIWGKPAFDEDHDG